MELFKPMRVKVRKPDVKVSYRKDHPMNQHLHLLTLGVRDPGLVVVTVVLNLVVRMMKK